jgi:hypothetical protein
MAENQYNITPDEKALNNKYFNEASTLNTAELLLNIGILLVLLKLFLLLLLLGDVFGCNAHNTKKQKFCASKHI